MFLPGRIKHEIEESRIDWEIALLFLPVAFFTYLFHESGHWLVGELLGNDMVIGLNNATPLNGQYVGPTHNLYISMGGPVFTILQAVVFLVVIETTKSIYAYPFVFFAAFSRLFSLFFGGFALQDEARISSILGTGDYLAAGIVLSVLSVVVWRSSLVLRLNLRAIGYYTVLGTLSILVVIGVNKLLM